MSGICKAICVCMGGFVSKTAIASNFDQLFDDAKGLCLDCVKGEESGRSRTCSIRHE